MTGFIGLSIVYVGLIGVILLALVTRNRVLRPIAVCLGAVGLWLPYAIIAGALGHANPILPTGNYRLIASDIDLHREVVHVLLEGYDGLSPPRSYRMALSNFEQERLPEGSAYEPPDVYISRGDSGKMEMLAVDYYPPDPPKGTRNYGQIGNN